jgi:hypothetical protein
MAARAKKKGFWENRPETGGKYLSGTEKSKLIENGTALEIVGVRYDEKNQFQGNPAPRFVVTFVVPANKLGVGEGERFAGFALSEDGSSRDDLLGDLIDYIGTPGAEKIVVQMVLKGQFVALERADA